MRRKFVIALLMIMGCGGDGKPSVSTSKDNVCNQMATVACYNMYQCCSEGQIESVLKVTDPRTEDECVTDMERLCEQKIGPTAASVAAGRMTFDAKAMNACLNALIVPDSNTCASVGSMLPWAMACMDPAWVGTVAVGGMCTRNAECADPTNTFCAQNQTCTALPTDGMACANQFPGQRCAAGFFCNGGTCRAQVAAGTMCNTDQQCMKGNFCNNAQPRVCAPLQGAGQACTGNASCESGRCLPGVCSNSASTCFGNADCIGSNRCSNNGNFCTQDATCNQGVGTCSVGGAACSAGTPCATGTCVFPTCILSTCTGSVVCADAQVNADYCTGATLSLPAPP